MTTRRIVLGWGTLLLLAAAAPAQDAGPQDGDRVAQAGRSRFRTFEGRFGDADRPRARPVDFAARDKDWAPEKKPEFRHRDGHHRPAQPGDKWNPAARKKDGGPSGRPQWSRDSRPDWQNRWRHGTFQFRVAGPSPHGSFGPFAGRHQPGGFGGPFAAASWSGHHRHHGPGQMGRHCGSGRCALASMRGGQRPGAMSRYSMARHRGHGHMGHGFGHQRMAWSRHHGHHGRHEMSRHHRGHHGRYAAWGRGGHGHRGHFACRGHHGGHRGPMGMHGGSGSFARNVAVGRMAALRWHHRGFGAGQFGRQSHGARGFSMGPWMMRSHWHGFGGGPQVRGPQFGERPQAHAGGPQFHRPSGPPARPASMPGRGPQARGGEPSKEQLSNRLERLQHELERLRRDAR